MKFQCKSCNAKLQAEDSKAGHVFPCPKCSKEVVVPSAWMGETIPEAPRTPPRTPETTTRQMIHPEVWDVCRMAVAHLLALLVFGVIAQSYLQYRAGQIQADLQKQLEAIPKPFARAR